MIGARVMMEKNINIVANAQNNFNFPASFWDSLINLNEEARGASFGLLSNLNECYSLSLNLVGVIGYYMSCSNGYDLLYDFDAIIESMSKKKRKKIKKIIHNIHNMGILFNKKGCSFHSIDISWGEMFSLRINDSTRENIMNQVLNNNTFQKTTGMLDDLYIEEIITFGCILSCEEVVRESDDMKEYVKSLSDYIDLCYSVEKEVAKHKLSEKDDGVEITLELKKEEIVARSLGLGEKGFSYLIKDKEGDIVCSVEKTGAPPLFSTSMIGKNKMIIHTLEMKEDYSLTFLVKKIMCEKRNGKRGAYGESKKYCVSAEKVYSLYNMYLKICNKVKNNVIPIVKEKELLSIIDKLG